MAMLKNGSKTMIVSVAPTKCSCCGLKDFTLIEPESGNWLFMHITDEDGNTLAAIDLWKCNTCGAVQMMTRSKNES